MTTMATINMDAHRPTEQRMEMECIARGLAHSHYSEWPHEPGVVPTDIGGSILSSDHWRGLQMAIWEHEDGLALLTTNDGELMVRGAGDSPLAAATVVEAVREILRPREDANPEVVPVNFWSATQHGGRNIRRDIDVAAWATIDDNYPSNEDLDALMQPEFRPGAGGQLLLWHGEPGTGKTTALRALANEWRDWCDLHYIVDPETFFGHRADYMMDVLTSEDEYIKSTDRVHTEPRWRLLVLEDCGEMLQPDARKEVGQALSRLLNACDGLIGRGLRILVLVTTNEPIDKLHEAVSRPGRCAARVQFDSFNPEQAHAWLDEHDVPTDGRWSARTLADLYGEVEGFRIKRQDRKVGFAA